MLTPGKRRSGGRLIVALLLATAALDITRCSLVVITYRHLVAAIGLVTAGVVLAVLSVAAARAYRAGRRWAVVVALLIGLASAPQASVSGFRPPFMIPDVATATLGVVLGAAILAAAGGAAPRTRTVSPCTRSSADPAVLRSSAPIR